MRILPEKFELLIFESDLKIFFGCIPSFILGLKKYIFISEWLMSPMWDGRTEIRL